jgi:hypothetical protein
MDSWLTALIASAAALGGSALTGFITYRVSRRDREVREAEELRAALVAYGAALDRLGFRVDQLPQAPGRATKWQARQLERWYTLDWLIGRLSTATLGRGVMRAIDELIFATNRLALIAPEPVLEAAEAINKLISRFEQGDGRWKADWQEARNALTAASRNAVPHVEPSA